MILAGTYRNQKLRSKGIPRGDAEYAEKAVSFVFVIDQTQGY
jgi:hypothetical protein